MTTVLFVIPSATLSLPGADKPEGLVVVRDLSFPPKPIKPKSEISRFARNDNGVAKWQRKGRKAESSLLGACATLLGKTVQNLSF